MKNILKLALVAVALLVASCGKNSDGNQTENARIVGTWKCVKGEDVKDGKRINPREIKDDGCTKYVFTDKTLVHYSPRDEDSKCVKQSEELYKIENGIIYIQIYNEVNKKHEYIQWYNKNVFVDNNTLELWDSDGISGAIFTYKRVK